MGHKITKRFKFVAGHRLTFHDGACYNRHGHNYEVKITAEADGLKDNMVVDFSRLGQLFDELVHKPWDHAFLYYEKDPLLQVDLEWNKKAREDNRRELKIVSLPFETTAENIAEHIQKLFYTVFRTETNGRVVVRRVKIYETPTNEAVYYG